MGVDVAHIIKHRPIDIHNHNECMDFCNETIEQLVNYYCYREEELFREKLGEATLHYEEGNGQSDYFFEFDGYKFSLHNDFWEVEPFVHYIQLFMHKDDFFWIRRTAFTLAKALGEKEAWHTDDYHTWDGGPTEEMDCSFEKWMDFVIHKTKNSIPEFSQQKICQESEADTGVPEHLEPVFHDDFKDLFALFDSVQSRIKDYRLISLGHGNKHEYLAEKDGIVYRISPIDLSILGQRVVEEPIFHATYDVRSKKEEHWFSHHEYVNFVSFYGAIPYSRLEKLNTAILVHDIKIVDISDLAVSFPNSKTAQWTKNLEDELNKKEQAGSELLLLEKMLQNKHLATTYKIKGDIVVSENGKVQISK